MRRGPGTTVVSACWGRDTVGSSSRPDPAALTWADSGLDTPYCLATSPTDAASTRRRATTT